MAVMAAFGSKDKIWDPMSQCQASQARLQAFAGHCEAFHSNTFKSQTRQVSIQIGQQSLHSILKL